MSKRDREGEIVGVMEQEQDWTTTLTQQTL